MTKEIKMSKQILEEMYQNKRISSIKIAEALGATKATILRKLKKFGINRRNSSEARLQEGFVYPSKEELKEMYEINLMTIEEIAEKLGISKGAVCNLFMNYNIHARNNSEAQRKRTNLERIAEKEMLGQMYLQEKLNCSQISERLGTSLSTANIRLKRHKIPIRNPTENIKYSQKEKELLERLYLEQGLSTPQIAEELEISVHVVGYRLKKYGIPIRDSSECHKGQECSDETRAKMSEAKKGEKNPTYGKQISKEHLMKLIESRKNYPKKARFLLNGYKFDSKDEAAVGSLFEKYIPDYKIQEGKNFQANGDTFCLYDFILPEAIVEWHPIQIRYDAPKEDRDIYRELKSEIKTKQDRINFRQLINNYKNDLAVDYWMKRQEASDKSQIYNGKEVVLARNFNELYDEVLKKYGTNLPSKSDLRKEFNSLRKQARLIKPKAA